jgi:hypothetical protein
MELCEGSGSGEGNLTPLLHHIIKMDRLYFVIIAAIVESCEE